MKTLKELIYEIKLIPTRISIFWDSLYNGDDEFHESLSMDLKAMLKMNISDRVIYVENLMKRRNKFHERDLLNRRK